MRKRTERLRYKLDGELLYSFDLDTEKEIYKYLCYKKYNKKIPSTNMFCRYSQWHDYIVEKYKSLEITTLKDFYKYLELGTRDIKPTHEFNSFVVPGFMALLFNMFFWFGSSWDIEEKHSFGEFIFLVIIFVIIYLFFVTHCLQLPISCWGQI